MKKARLLFGLLLVSLTASGCDAFNNLFPPKEKEEEKQKEDEKEDKKVDVESILLPEEIIDLEIGTYHQITHYILPEKANQEVEYESSDEDAAIVYPDGKIYGVGVGDLKVRVTSVENHNVWDEIDVTVYDNAKHYTITYFGNGGTGSVKDDKEYEPGASVTVKSNSFTRSGYNFLNFNTKANGTGTSYNPGDTLTINSNIELYAQWEQSTVITYSLNYNANGGEGSMVDPGSPYAAGSLVTVLGNVFTKSGHNFVNFNTKANGSGTSYNAGSKFTINSNVTLYAQWEEESEDEFNGYYKSINPNSSTLLSDLRTLNLSKRTRAIDYDDLNANFKYTDYDPNTIQYDDKGQPYGTKLLSFYSGKSTTSYNKEHVWPNSRGGGSKKGKSGAPYVENDIYMPRPTINEENTDRGNSSFVEGMNHSSNGWDPVTAFAKTIGVYDSIRGECARIIFYCMTVNGNLRIVDDANIDFSGEGGRVTIGKLSDMLRWNLLNPVNEREVRRQSGGQYLQGNRNAFVDHPEYACKIWGNTNSTTKSICGM